MNLKEWLRRQFEVEGSDYTYETFPVRRVTIYALIVFPILIPSLLLIVMVIDPYQTSTNVFVKYAIIVIGGTAILIVFVGEITMVIAYPSILAPESRPADLPLG